MSVYINRVILLGNLTRDPELKPTLNVGNICTLRIVVNERVKDANTGAWRDRPNYFDVEVFGSLGERCARWLREGSEVVVDGRLRWRQSETPDGQRGSATSVIADNVEFIGVFAGAAAPEGEGEVGSDKSVATPPADAVFADDDIPF